MDKLIHPQMAARQHTSDANGCADLADFSGRKLAQHITGSSIHIGFVESHPAVAKIVKTLHDVPSKTLEKGGCLGIKKSALLLEPMRMGEVVKADHGLDTSFEKGPQQFAITGKGLRVPAALLRFDTCPLHREAQCVKAQITREIEVAFGIRPPVARLPAAIPGTN